MKGFSARFLPPWVLYAPIILFLKESPNAQRVGLSLRKYIVGIPLSTSMMVLGNVGRRLPSVIEGEGSSSYRTGLEKRLRD